MLDSFAAAFVDKFHHETHALYLGEGYTDTPDNLLTTQLATR